VYLPLDDKLIAIIDYGMGNVQSVSNAFSLLGESVKITSEPIDLKEAKAIVLPGVGAFSDGLENLRKRNLLPVLEEQVLDKKKPYLGICLGLQFLAEKSYEGGEYDGFGWVKGKVIKLDPSTENLKIPHMGWNDTTIIKKGGLLKEIMEPVFYYLHSYFLDVDPSENNVITSICNYGNNKITATLQKDNIYAVQFHPEKSQLTGLKLLKNFLEDLRE
jgi:glutamine amidotransferase